MGVLFVYVCVYELLISYIVHKFTYQILYCPTVFNHFLDPPGNHPRGAIFPTVDEINQPTKNDNKFPQRWSKHFVIDLFDWLIDWR